MATIHPSPTISTTKIREKFKDEWYTNSIHHICLSNVTLNLITVASKAKATQDFVPIQEVRDGIAILKDGSMRAVLLASSLNFALKSEDEQTGITMQFQNFLNSLDFSIQIFVQSRRLDIRPYIALLEDRHKQQVGELLKIQTREYIDFIKNFIENSNIMSKSFFVVVPYNPAVIQTNRVLPKNFLGFGGSGSESEKSSVDKKLSDFEEQRTQIEQRLSVVEQGLTRTGVRVVQLGTEEVIELFYKIFNPGDLEKPINLTK